MKIATDHLLKNGYAVLPNFISAQKCDQAIAQIDRLINGFSPSPQQLIAFDAQSSNSHANSEYFRKSADNISFFLEPSALKDGKIVVPKLLSVNKIGHALGQLNKVFRQITFDNRVNQICQNIGIKNPVLVQSMAILKQPKIGAQVPTHQDSTYLYGQPDTLCGFWMPLQDATLENGCLWGIPGSHKEKLYTKSRHLPDGSHFTDVLHQREYKKEQFVPIQMKRGSLVFFLGKFLHRSEHNNSTGSRYAYTWHMMDQNSKWAQDNWLQRPKFVKLSSNKASEVL